MTDKNNQQKPPYKNWKSDFYASILNTELEAHLSSFAKLLNDWQCNANSRVDIKLQLQLSQLPPADEVEVSIADTVTVCGKEALSKGIMAKTKSVLQQFKPWRKGPFNFFGIEIDTEWRSDWKWNRILPHLGSLQDKKVLDVGCGSGYHLFRMLGEDAKYVLGIDPTSLFFYQFQCFKQYISNEKLHFLPVGIELMPKTEFFDTVFSMGVLYHRQDPFKFLQELKDQLSDGGTLVLETLVVDGDETTVLVPQNRYAQMRNVWFIPSVEALSVWMQRIGFKNIRCVDVSATSLEEQRKTEWIDSHSLADFLDSENRNLTKEGYPAPLRATLIATK